MRLLVITQAVDSRDPNLGFFHEWLGRLSGEFSLVDVIAQSVGRHDLPANVNLFGLRLRMSDVKILRLWRMLFLLWRLVPQSDGIFIHMAPTFAIIAWPFALAHKKPMALWYVHKQVDWKLRLAEKMVDRVFSASPESFRLKSKKLVLLGHGIDTALFLAPQTEAHGCILMTAGRISRSKRVDVLLRAVILASQNLPQGWRFLIYGSPITKDDNLYRSELNQLVSSHHFEKQVEFVGGIEHNKMPEKYQAASLFLHASKTGSIDKAVLEAMSTGLPVVSSSEGFRALLPHEYVISSATPEAFCHAIRSYWNRGRDMRLRDTVTGRFELSRLILALSASLKEL